MILDINCVRSCLLSLEHESALDDCLKFIDIPLDKFANLNSLNDYSKKDIAFTVYTLADAGYIEAGQLHLDVRMTTYFIRRITYKGYAFLESIREEQHWNTVKRALASVRNYSLDCIGVVAQGITNAAIDKAINSIF